MLIGKVCEKREAKWWYWGLGIKQAVISIVVSCQGQMSKKVNNADTLNVDLVNVENASYLKLVLALQSVWRA